MNSFEKQWDDLMSEHKQDDLKSKVAALDAVKSLADRNDVKTAGDVLEIIKSYREALSVQLKGEKDE